MTETFGEAFFQHSKDLFSVVAPSFEILRVNSAWTTLLGWEPDELVGKPFLDFLHPDDRDRTLADIGRFRAALPVIRDDSFFVNRYLKKGGGFRWFSWSTIPDKERGVWLAIGRDVTETKRMEAQLRAAIEGSLDAVFFTRAMRAPDTGEVIDFVYTDVNRNVEVMIGARREDLIGKRMRLLYPVVDEVGLFDRFRASFETGETLEDEYPLASRDGRMRWFYQQTAATPEGVVIHLREITERKRLVARLADALAQAELYRSALDKSAVVCITDSEGRTIHINDNLTALTGFTRDDLIGRVPDLFVGLRQHVDAAGEPWSGETVMRTQHGVPVWVHATIVPLKSDDGRVLRNIVIAYDVTAKKKAEEQLHYVSKMTALGEMSSGIAHEINNPLTIIQGYGFKLERLVEEARRAAEGASWDEVSTIARRVQETALRIARIIQGLRAFSREATHDPIQSCPVERIVEDALELCRERFRNHGVDVRVTIEPRGLALGCRAVHIVQVLINLLTNAFDAIQRLPERWIEITAKREVATKDEETAMVVISVTDAGRGIPASYRDKVMVPFFTTKDVGSGTGLGLSISKGLVEAHGGTLSLDTTSEHTRFVIRLPENPA